MTDVALTRWVLQASMALVLIAWAYSAGTLISVYRQPWIPAAVRGAALARLWPLVAVGPLVLTFLALALWATR
jgi:hypothetical protein